MKKTKRGYYKKSLVMGWDQSGKLIRKYFYGKTQQDVNRQLSEAIQAKEWGMIPSDEKATFGPLAFSWLNEFKPLISEKTRVRYEGIIKNQLEPLHKMKLKELKPMHLQAIINRMARDGYAQKSMNHVKQTASQIMELALENDIVFRNVFAKVRVPHVDANTREPITPEQRNLIITTWKGHRMGVPALLMLYCGLRRGEMLALTWNDIDFKNQLVHVNKAVEYPRNLQASIKKPKTKAGTRDIPIPDAIMTALKEYRTQSTSLYFCPSVQTGGLMSNQAYTEAWKSYMHYLNIQAGGSDKVRIKNEDGKYSYRPAVTAMKSFTAHQLRHSYATMLYDAGVDVKTAQRYLGHADINVTMKVYTHLSDRTLKESTAKMNEHVSDEIRSAKLLIK